MRQVCHAVDRMGDTRFCLNVRWRSRLCAARAVHVRHPAIPIHVRRRLEKLRPLASVRLTCIIYIIQSLHAGTIDSIINSSASAPKNGKKIAVKKVIYIYVSMSGPEL